MISTTTLQAPQPHSQRALSAQGHPPRSRASNFPSIPRSASHPHPTRQYDKDLVLKHLESTQRKESVPPPEEIASDPGEKEVGFSSKTLKFSDFELMQTLGTGKHISVTA